MRRIAWLLVPPLLASTHAVAAAQSDCSTQRPRNFAWMEQLPPGAIAAMRYRMAERGARYQAGDALRPGPRLPSRRFISARQVRCTLTIRYEQGGVGHSVHTAILERDGERWLVLRDR